MEFSHVVIITVAETAILTAILIAVDINNSYKKTKKKKELEEKEKKQLREDLIKIKEERRKQKNKHF